ncbi:unnamed protein product [Oppiella nova]|uniref:Uncharacterized protein n=1 Tax=Oppiella nova TaxID=334625 RepID=A0A7R9MKA1_9ACAR|nr:unnamed protein product [Oppiella nova]CAG2178718.1 unnamed protein product [Oppiella nova]
MSLMDVMPDIRVLGDTLWRNGKESSPQIVLTTFIINRVGRYFAAITCDSTSNMPK